MVVVAGINMAKTGFTNILNNLESGNLRALDVAIFLGGVTISGCQEETLRYPDAG